MSRFAQYTIANAPAGSQPLLEKLEKSLGFVPNLFAAIAESPSALAGTLALDASLEQGSLTKVERQLVKVAVSTENGCTYCVAAHSTIAGMLRARPEVVSAVRNGTTVPDQKLDALVRFARSVVRAKGFAADSDLAAFLGAGYSKAQVLEVVGLVGVKTLENYAHALTQAPLDKEFEAQRWEPTQLRVA